MQKLLSEPVFEMKICFLDHWTRLMLYEKFKKKLTLTLFTQTYLWFLRSHYNYVLDIRLTISFLFSFLNNRSYNVLNKMSSSWSTIVRMSKFHSQGSPLKLFYWKTGCFQLFAGWQKTHTLRRETTKSQSKSSESYFTVKLEYKTSNVKCQNDNK